MGDDGRQSVWELSIGIGAALLDSYPPFRPDFIDFSSSARKEDLGLSGRPHERLHFTVALQRPLPTYELECVRF